MASHEARSKLTEAPSMLPPYLPIVTVEKGKSGSAPLLGCRCSSAYSAPILAKRSASALCGPLFSICARKAQARWLMVRSEEHTSELQSLRHLVCRLLLEK